MASLRSNGSFTAPTRQPLDARAPETASNDDIFAAKIVFGDHATQTIGMAPEATTGSSEPSRLEIGTIMQRTGGPPPTKP